MMWHAFKLILCFFLALVTISKAIFPIKIDEKLVISKGKLQEFLAHDDHTYAIFYFTRMNSKLVTYCQAVADFSSEAESHRIKFGMYDCVSDTEEKECSRQTDGLQVSVYLGKQFVQSVDLITKLTKTVHHHDLMFSTLLQIKLAKLNWIEAIGDHSHLQSALETSKSENSKLLVLFITNENSAEHTEYLKVINAVASYYPRIRFTYTLKQELIELSRGQAEMLAYLARTFLPHLFVYDCGTQPEEQAISDCFPELHPGLIEPSSMVQMLNIITNVKELKTAISLDLPYTVCFYDTHSEKEEIEDVLQSLDDYMYGVMFTVMAARTDDYVLSLLPKVQELIKNGRGAECYIHDVDLETESRKYVELAELQQTLKKMIRAKFDAYRKRKVDNQNETNRGQSGQPQYERNSIDDELALIEAVETQDDELAVLENGMGGRRGFRLKNAKVLTRGTWDSGSYSGLVMFHLSRYDHISRIVLRMYDELAADVETVELATLDCHDWTDVCRDHKVTAFPLVRGYKKGKMTPYNGDMSMEGLKRLTQLYKYDTPQIVTSQTEVQEYQKEITELQMKPVIGCFKSTKDREYVEFQRASKRLFGQRLLIASTDSAFSKQVAWYLELGDLPTVGLFDPETKTAEKLENKKMISAVFVKSYGLRSAYDKFPAVTPQNMMHIVDQTVPQVFLFTKDLNEPLSQAVKAVAEKGQPGYGMAYLDMNVPLNRKIHVEMIPKDSDISLPTMLVVKYKTGGVYEFSKKDLDESNSENLIQHIKKWLIAIGEGIVPESAKLAKGDWKPKHPGYDFLAMIEREKKLAQQKQPLGRFESVQSRAQMNEEQDEKAEMEHQSTGEPMTETDINMEGSEIVPESVGMDDEASPHAETTKSDPHEEL